jgi:dipeptidyl aminopeptidase/acylaminoacyl peptidase
MCYSHVDITVPPMSFENQTYQNIAIKSGDGTKIYGCLLKPDGEGPFPALIFIHGGLGNNRELTRAMLDWSLAGLLLQEDFVVLSTDYRRDFTGKDIPDITAAFAHAADLPFVDGKKIAYFGDSHGSYLALMAAPKTAPFAIVHGWGVANMADWFWHIKNSTHPFFQGIVRAFQESFGGSPERVPEMYEKVSPTAHAAAVNCPVLIVHGEKDEEVPVAHAHKLAEAFKKAHREYELNVFKNAGHGLPSPGIRQQMDTVVLNFLRKHLRK